MRKSWLPTLGAMLLVLGAAAATAVALPQSVRITDEPGLVQPIDPVRTVGGSPDGPAPGSPGGGPASTNVPVLPEQPTGESPAVPPPAPVPVPPAGSIDIDDDDIDDDIDDNIDDNDDDD